MYKINSITDNSRLSQSTLNLAVQNEAIISPSTSALSMNADIVKKDDLFIEDAIKELLKSRRILRSSYVFGYYLDNINKRFAFEFIQTEFEECTEDLSQIIARPHLKTPRNKIIKTTKILKSKRIEFLDIISKNLTLPMTPPTSRRRMSTKRWNYLLKDDSQDDDELKSAIAMSIKDLNPKDPWIVDKKGRHTNLIALLNDMPELEGNLSAILVPSKNKGLCKRIECSNPKSINSLTGQLLPYCSINCMRNDRDLFLNSIVGKEKKTEQESQASTGLSSLIFDDETFNAELEKAMRLSEQQILKERISHYDSDEQLSFNNEEDMRIAIELSLETYNNENDYRSSIDNLTEKPADQADSTDKQYKKMPYDPFYIANRSDLTTLFKNMTDIMVDENDKGKATNKKLSSFEKKSSAMKHDSSLAKSSIDEDKEEDPIKNIIKL